MLLHEYDEALVRLAARDKEIREAYAAAVKRRDAGDQGAEADIARLRADHRAVQEAVRKNEKDRAGYILDLVCGPNDGSGR